MASIKQKVLMNPSPSFLKMRANRQLRNCALSLVLVMFSASFEFSDDLPPVLGNIVQEVYFYDQ
jgi:hypothetical protein